MTLAFRHLWDRLFRSLMSRQTWALETFLAAQAITWGVWVGWPWTEAFAASRSYALLSHLPEWFVGAVFVGHGLAHMASIYRQDTGACARAAFVAGALWAAVAVNVGLMQLHSPALPIYIASSLGSGFVYLRLHWRFG